MNIEITAGGVFLIIALAAFIIGWIIYKKVKPKNQGAANKNIIIENTAPFAIPVSQTENKTEEKNDEEELIAVISAAVAAMLNKPVSGFRVVAFKKRGNWQ